MARFQTGSQAWPPRIGDWPAFRADKNRAGRAGGLAVGCVRSEQIMAQGFVVLEILLALGESEFLPHFLQLASAVCPPGALKRRFFTDSLGQAERVSAPV